MNTKTQINQIQKGIEMTTMGYLISIRREDDVIIKVEATPYLGKLYTIITYTAVDENCRPIFRAIVPPWVWRRTKKMIKMVPICIRLKNSSSMRLKTLYR